MTQRMPWDPRRLRLADQHKLAAAGVKLEDEKVAAYVKNRNDYSGYNVGRDQVDAYLNDAAISLYGGADGIVEVIRAAAHAAMNATDRLERGVSHQQAADALAGLSGILSALQQRVDAIAAAVAVRAGDDDADDALHRFSDALSGRTTPPED